MEIVNVDRIAIPDQNGIEDDFIEVTAVLTSGHPDKDQDYAVYIGVGTKEFVAFNGSKLNHDRALFFFPQLPKDLYRK